MKPRRKLTFLLILSLLAISANAQRIGIKGGLSLAKMQENYTGTNLTTSNLTGFQAGLVIEGSVTESVFLNSGVLFSQKGTKLNIMGVNCDVPVNYVEVPVNLALKYDLGSAKLFAQAGPYAAIGLSAKMKAGGQEETIEFGSDSEDLKRFDAGIGFGCGIEIKKIQFGVNYDLGLMNISNDPDETSKNRALTISITLFLK